MTDIQEVKERNKTDIFKEHIQMIIFSESGCEGLEGEGLGNVQSGSARHC